MRKKGELSYLLLCLLFILIVYPFIEKAALAGRILALFFSLTLIVGVYALSEHNRPKLIISLTLATPAIILIWFDQFFNNKILNILTFSFMSLFSFFTMGCIVSYLMSAKKITKDILAGAVSAYLLIGISFGMLYGLLELVNPGSFAIDKVTSASALSKGVLFNYYSFTTLTTLGYGDIIPISSRAQSFAVLEVVSGVLFVALLVSRLVGMHLYQMRLEDSE